MFQPNLNFVHQANFDYLCKGITLDSNDAGVFDNVFSALDKYSGIVSRIVENNRIYRAQGDMEFTGGQLMIFIDKYRSEEKKLSTSTVVKNLAKPNDPPAVYINLHSPTLDIPQRLEIPLRYLVHGMPDLKGTYMVYLHALEIDNGDTFSYYGITKRGWMKRFQEHMILAMKGSSDQLFQKLLSQAIGARSLSLRFSNFEESIMRQQLTVSYHVVRAAGRTIANT